MTSCHGGGRDVRDETWILGQLTETNPTIPNLTIYALTIIEILDGLIIFLGRVMVVTKRVNGKIR